MLLSGRDNRLFTVNVKWLMHLASTNNFICLEHFFVVLPQNWNLFFPVCATSQDTEDSIAVSTVIFVLMTDGIVFINDYLTETSVCVCFWSKNCHEMRLSTWKTEAVFKQWSSPFLSAIEFSPTKEIRPSLSIEPLISHVLKFLLAEGHSLFLH